MKKTRIIATVGPACCKLNTLCDMINAGVNVCRLNLSFGTQEDHLKTIAQIRQAGKKTGKAVAIMMGLQGPKIRIGKLNKPVTVKRGETITLSGKAQHKSELYFPTTYKQIASDTCKGKTILIADGKIIVKVKEVLPAKKEVICTVTCGGTILTGKGINLPDTKISLPALTPKDKADAKFAAKAGVDYLALSFVRDPKDVEQLKRLIKKAGADIPVIAKVEKPEALTYLDEILDVADGVMVARGDLADEISFARVPIAQKEIIHKANSKGKITITATEMLSSMIDNPLPTRAETSDVANAVWDGTDAVMLSNETAMGKYPLKSVKVMAEVIRETERAFFQFPNRTMPNLDLPQAKQLHEAICASASHLSYQLNEKGMVALTYSGSTARILSKFRPESTIFAIALNERVYHRLAFYHNVYPILLDQKVRDGILDTSSIECIHDQMIKRRLVKKGDQLIVISGHFNVNRWIADTIRVVNVD